MLSRSLPAGGRRAKREARKALLETIGLLPGKDLCQTRQKMRRFCIFSVEMCGFNLSLAVLTNMSMATTEKRGERLLQADLLKRAR